jgi:hypothetical protein
MVIEPVEISCREPVKAKKPELVLDMLDDPRVGIGGLRQTRLPLTAKLNFG